jgi:hypothetical protein
MKRNINRTCILFRYYCSRCDSLAADLNGSGGIPYILWKYLEIMQRKLWSEALMNCHAIRITHEWSLWPPPQPSWSTPGPAATGTCLSVLPDPRTLWDTTWSGKRTALHCHTLWIYMLYFHLRMRPLSPTQLQDINIFAMSSETTHFYGWKLGVISFQFFVTN